LGAKQKLLVFLHELGARSEGIWNWRCDVAKIVKKSFDAPEETRSLHKGKIEAVDLGGVEIRRVTHEPGWRWSECVKPTVETDSCQVGHLIHVLSGRIVVRMDD